MSSTAETLLKEMCIPDHIITQVLKITQKEEEAVNLALELMENPVPSKTLDIKIEAPPVFIVINQKT